MSGQAAFSDCGTYRYALSRDIDHGLIPAPHIHETVNFIMLNPSTATAEMDDPTVRRCMGYARSWGYGRLVVTNLFAYRATKPQMLRAVVDPVGPYNDGQISRAAEAATLVVAAWGNDGPLYRRDEAVRRIVQRADREMHCLAVSMQGQPVHPLYQRADLVPVAYGRPSVPDETPPDETAQEQAQ